MTRITPTTRRRGGRSRQGGVPTSLPPVGSGAQSAGAPTAARQLALSIGGPELDQRSRQEVLPDVVFVPDWLDLEAQRDIVEQFRQWALPPAGLRHPRVPTGHLMSVQSVCLGWHWQPYTYSRTADDTDGAPVKPLPDSLRELGRDAVSAAYGPGTSAAHPGVAKPGDSATSRELWGPGVRRSTGGPPNLGDPSDGPNLGEPCHPGVPGSPGAPAAVAYEPDAAIVNLYAPDARLGVHQDGEEPSGAPVVTISIGDTCTFRLAGVDRRTGPFTDIELRSGDLVVFGGVNRRIYHGVPKVFAGTAPDGLGLPPGRLSLTLRETGLD